MINNNFNSPFYRFRSHIISGQNVQIIVSCRRCLAKALVKDKNTSLLTSRFDSWWSEVVTEGEDQWISIFQFYSSYLHFIAGHYKQLEVFSLELFQQKILFDKQKEFFVNSPFIKKDSRSVEHVGNFGLPLTLLKGCSINHSLYSSFRPLTRNVRGFCSK